MLWTLLISLLACLPVLTAAPFLTKSKRDEVNLSHANNSGFEETHPFDRPNLPLDEEVMGMLKEMPLQEKIGQMSQLDIEYLLLPDGTINTTALDSLANEFFIGSFFNVMKRGGNGNPNTIFNAKEYVETINKIQTAYANSRAKVKVPIVYGIDSVHGANYIANATIFPQGIAQAASWDPQVAHDIAVITAKDTRAANMHWTFAPILDLSVDKQWPRVYENFGESPFLTASMARASILGFQGQYKSDRTKVAACMKHFVGYSATRMSFDHGDAWIPLNYLQDYFIPPFQAAVEAGVATAMESYNSINGFPVVSSKLYLRDILREQMQFKGMLVTDYSEIRNLVDGHLTETSEWNATAKILSKTSIDMSMIALGTSFPKIVYELVRQGVIPESRIDESAGRVLQLKKDLGLFETKGILDPSSPLVSSVGQEEDAKVALHAARESITLLKNDNRTLPFSDANTIAVVGPTCNNLYTLSGGWTIEWQGVTEDRQFYGHGVSIADGIRQVAKNAAVTYTLGVGLDGTESEDTSQNIDAAVQRVLDADVAVVCLGENPYAEAPGFIHDLTLPAGQLKLARAVASTRKPFSLVLVQGRPRVIADLAELSPAILNAYLPGPYGGLAIADTLFGINNPSGKLPYTYPKYPGDQTLIDWRPRTDEKLPNGTWAPLYPFGHGLSYTTFSYSDIRLSGDTLSPVQTILVKISVTNTGEVAGKEVVQLFTRQHYRSVLSPTRMLNGFKKVFLDVGETKEVEFKLTVDIFRFTEDPAYPRQALEEGLADVMIADKRAIIKIQSGPAQ
ncbi:uncharacterized protein VTP21DRAFT_15 [Calcarisporiella thermophila]|uniref:uncharacterized protein n=1 Tax=Calcarisporiella thermophila TaxID=911321 RepID=UPI003743AA25